MSIPNPKGRKAINSLGEKEICKLNPRKQGRGGGEELSEGKSTNHESKKLLTFRKGP